MDGKLDSYSLYYLEVFLKKIYRFHILFAGKEATMSRSSCCCCKEFFFSIKKMLLQRKEGTAGDDADEAQVQGQTDPSPLLLAQRSNSKEQFGPFTLPESLSSSAQ